MLVSVNAYTFDLGGSVILDCKSAYTAAGGRPKRVNRVATLDGSAAFNDFGFSDADRTIELTWQPDAATDETVQRIHQLHSRVFVSLPGEVFVGYPETLSPGDSENTWRILIAEKLN